MKAKLLLIFLILLSFLVIGCVDDTEEPMNDSNMTNESSEDIVNETVPDDIITNETVEDEELSEEEDKPLDVVGSTDPRTYTIYMENFLTHPGNVTINAGDTVVWFNRNDPTRLFTLVSNEGLWENVTIGKRLTYRYTFNETGTYTYKVLGWEGRMKGTIIVK